MIMTDSTLIEVEQLQKTYPNGFTALTGVSFTVRAGETLALLGPNGAGKSTTIEILEGYRKRSGGTARVLGVDPSHGGRDWYAQLGIVLQTNDDMPNLTVREQLNHFAALYPNPRNVDELIEAVGLGAKANTRISKLSGGQRRRVDVALGIVGNPRVLFLDEPTTGFDPEARHEFWELVRTLREDGTSILLTTHYLEEAAALSDTIAIIAGGELIAHDSIDSIGGVDARLPQVRWLTNDGWRSERTTHPGELVASLVARGEELRELEIIRPTLENIYLDLLAHHEAGTLAETKGELR